MGDGNVSVCFTLDHVSSERALKDLSYAVLAIGKVIENIDKLPPNATVSYTWECGKSPVGYCAYDESEDPCRDDCIFCHDPEERK